MLPISSNIPTSEPLTSTSKVLRMPLPTIGDSLKDPLTMYLSDNELLEKYSNNFHLKMLKLYRNL